MKPFVVVLAGVATLAACASQRPEEVQFAGSQASSRSMTEPAALAAAPQVADSFSGGAAASFTASSSGSVTATEVQQVAAEQRQIVYEAALGLRVPNTREALSRIESYVDETGGYVARSTLDRIVFRVAPGDFSNAIDWLEQLGEVTSRSISSTDVTEEYLDLELRIDTAEKSRQRLIELLERVDQTAEVLEIERDIRRLTEEIETLKGKLRLLESRVEWATITVTLSPIVDVAEVPGLLVESPFPWVRMLGAETMLANPGRAFTNPSWFSMWFGDFDLAPDVSGTRLPDGFVPLTQRTDYIFAATPENYRLLAREFDVPDNVSLDDWVTAAESALEENRGYALADPQQVQMKNEDLAGTLLSGDVRYGGSIYEYRLWIIAEPGDDGELLTIEYVRPKGSPAARDITLSAAVAGIDW